MLLRMYQRWTEGRGWEIELTDVLAGETAGMKSATLLIKGEFAYGFCKAERGVHRLVRISPFDSNKRRHTSFSSVDVIAEIEETSSEIVLPPAELQVDTYRSGGKGGQNVNKVETAIRITHLPTNIVVGCQAQRSQGKNREMAMKMLRSRLYDLEVQKRQAHTDKLDESKLDISFGSQIRSYVMQPYRMIKDHRTKFSAGDVDRVMDGDIDPFIRSYLMAKKTKGKLDVQLDDDEDAA
jgi:peptide chain release factor 2